MSTIPQSLPSATLPQETASENQAHSPLVRPLCNYQGLLVSSFDALPQEGVFCELLKRICIIAVAPLAYLVLGLLALPGMSYDFLKSQFCPDPDVENPPPANPESQNEERHPDERISLLQNKMIGGIERKLDYSNIDRARLFLYVKIDDAYPFSGQFSLKTLNDPALDRSSLREKIQEVFNNAQPSIASASADSSITFRWHFLVKDVDSNMISIQGEDFKSPSSSYQRGPTWMRIPRDEEISFHSRVVVQFDDPAGEDNLSINEHNRRLREVEATLTL